MGVSIRATSGPAIERPGDLAAILTNLGQGDVLFIDEIHRLPRIVEELLYPAMEDFALDIIIGKGPGAHSLRLELPLARWGYRPPACCPLKGSVRVKRLEFTHEELQKY